MAAQNIPVNSNQDRENTPVLPPGFRFFPSDEEIFRYYLVKKNDHPSPYPANCVDHNVIGELDVYGDNPSELAENPYFEYGSGGPTRHWYFYAADRGSDERQRRIRAVNCGFWLMRGSGNAVVGGSGDALGTKSCFVFYLGTSLHNAVATDWTMHEFALPDHAQASFVLYRLFVKSRAGSSSPSARNGVLTSAPGGNQEDVISGNGLTLVTIIHNHVPQGQIPRPVHLNQTIYQNSTVNHHYGDNDGSGNVAADFAATPAAGASRADYIELNDFFSPL